MEREGIQVECLQEVGTRMERDGIRVECLQDDDTQPVVVQDGTPVVYVQYAMNHCTKDVPCNKCRDHGFQSCLGALVPNLKVVGRDGH